MHLRLTVGLLRVGDLDGMTWGTAKEIDSLSRLRRRKRAARILEDSTIVIVIVNLISLEIRTTLVLPQVFSKLSILFNAYTKKGILGVRYTPPTSCF